ncbi:MAG: RusA family crossover junction endodeoxyribonuclease [Gammaproteobacteria bacterium]|nr:MAG: RusA family crossover junction endodeoxyribonuclease [Gammaproteobacteria bacterium]
MKYNITCVPKPRQTRADKWKKRPCVLRYRAFADECRLNKITIPEQGSHISFYMPMPKSWSKKKKASMLGYPHEQTPDIDNLIKSLMDAVMKQDCGVWDIRITKMWAYEGAIEIT